MNKIAFYLIIFSILLFSCSNNGEGILSASNEEEDISSYVDTNVTKDYLELSNEHNIKFNVNFLTSGQSGGWGHAKVQSGGWGHANKVVQSGGAWGQLHQENSS